MKNPQDSVWLYDSVRKLNLKPSEELVYSFLIKKSFYEFKDYCTDDVFDKDGKVDWIQIEDSFGDTPIVPFWKYQTSKFQQYIEENLGLSRMSFFRAIKSLQEQGLLVAAYAEQVYSGESVIELFKDDYRTVDTISHDRSDGELYVLRIDYESLYFSKYRNIYLEKGLLKSPKLLYFYSWMLDRYNYWKEQGKKFMTSAEHLAEEYGVGFKNFSKMVTELKALGYIRKDYKKEWYVGIK